MLQWIRNALAGHSGVRSGTSHSAERIASLMREADGARQTGILSRAEEIYQEVLEADPDHAAALYGLGEVALRAGRNEDAAGLMSRAISIDGSKPQYHFGLGCALHALHDWQGAEEAYRCALQSDAAHSGARTNLACILQERAETQASARGPELAARDLDEAVAHFRAVQAMAPGNAQAWLNLGYAMARQRRLDDALRCYEQSIALDPELADAHFNRSSALLAQGKFAEGWSEYEWRWKASGFPRPAYPQPEWDGSPLAGRTLLLYTEQGFGDAIQFVRYVPLVAARGGRVMVRSTRELQRLFASVPGVSLSFTPEQAPPEFHVHCSLLSLPRVLGASVEVIPENVPYIDAEKALADKWRAETVGHSGLRVGLVWASQPMARIAPLKSVPFHSLAALLRVKGVRYFGLQKGAASTDASASVGELVSLGERLEDFADTAAVIAAMDLTISVDTAVAHLAGAMGKPVWTLLPYVPDWRWQPDADVTPWYPSMRLYRQSERGNWSAVVARVAEDLGALRARISPT